MAMLMLTKYTCKRLLLPIALSIVPALTTTTHSATAPSDGVPRKLAYAIDVPVSFITYSAITAAAVLLVPDVFSALGLVDVDPPSLA